MEVFDSAQLCSSSKGGFPQDGSAECHFRRCVTLARATAKAWMALNGYWKSSVYALLSMRPNCITCNKQIVILFYKVQSPSVHTYHYQKTIVCVNVNAH